MSLIDEALKRAELEAARRDGLRGGAYPWVPQHSPKRRRRWIAIAAVVVAAAAGAGAWWLSRRAASPSGAPSHVPSGAAGVVPTVPAAEPKIEMQAVEVAPPPVGIVSKPPVRREPAGQAPASAEASKLAPTSAPRSAPEKGSRPEGPRVGPADEARTVAGAAADKKSYFGEMTAPDGAKITLEGIVWSETNPVALINGKVLPPGAVVEELTITGIQPDHIELKGRGMTFSLALK